MKKCAIISLFLALLIALSPVYAAIGMAAGRCQTCGNTGVCVKCEGDGKCPSCYNGTGYSGPCVICKDEVPGKCNWCYGTKMWVSPTGKVKTCPRCADGLCAACKGTALSTVECGICMVTGKCYACGGDGGCADCQWLDREARVLREQLMANLSGKKITTGQAIEIIGGMMKQCGVCLGLGQCNSCGGKGYERCPKRCMPSDPCFSCDGDGYKSCSVCGGSGSCSACGGDGIK